jgi:hypothetical protein
VEYDNEIQHKDEVRFVRKPSLRDLKMTQASIRLKINKEKARLKAQAKINDLVGTLHNLRTYGREEK